MSDVRPELQQIREALDAFVDGYMATDPPQARKVKTQLMVDAVYPALARVEATLNALEAASASLVESAKSAVASAESAVADGKALHARVVAAERRAEMLQRHVNDAERIAEEQIARAVAAEAERDALVAALERIATGNFLEAWDAQQIARAYLASVSATGASGALQKPLLVGKHPKRPGEATVDLARYEEDAAYRAEVDAKIARPAPAEPPREENA